MGGWVLERRGHEDADICIPPPPRPSSSGKQPAAQPPALSCISGLWPVSGRGSACPPSPPGSGLQEGLQGSPGFQGKIRRETETLGKCSEEEVQEAGRWGGWGEATWLNSGLFPAKKNYVLSCRPWVEVRQGAGARAFEGLLGPADALLSVLSPALSRCMVQQMRGVACWTGVRAYSLCGAQSWGAGEGWYREESTHRPALGTGNSPAEGGASAQKSQH